MKFPDAIAGQKIRDYIQKELKTFLLGERVISGRGILIKQTNGGKTISVTGVDNIVPRGTVVMVHLFPDEAIDDFFDMGTGLGLGRWLGWALCDGQNDGPDMLAKFPVCADVDNDDYDIQGAGANTNGQTGFTYHSLKHSHALSFDPPPHEVGATGSGVWAWDSTDNTGGISINDEAGCIVWSGYSSSDYQIPETVPDLSAPASVDFILDNRPKNYVIHFAVKL